MRLQAEENRRRQEKEKAEDRAKEQETVRKYLEVYQKVDRDRKLKMESQRMGIECGYKQRLEESKQKRETELRVKREERQVVDEYTQAVRELDHKYLHSAKV